MRFFVRAGIFPAKALGGLALAASLTGCLSSAPPAATTWTVDAAPVLRAPSVEPKPLFAATRLGSVSVLAPYDRPSFAVRREDGSLSFDPCNAFAAQPAAILKGPLMAGLQADGRFGHVVPQASVVSADAVVEVVVPELTLDCRHAGARKARAAVTVNVMKNGREGRTVELSGQGSAEADATGGDYSAAFSAAVNSAVANALSGMK